MLSLDLKSALGTAETALLEVLGLVAARQGLEAYLVGGVVRDVLLGGGSLDKDIDIMTVGDALAFTRELYARWAEHFPGLTKPKKPIIFKKYGTAKLLFEPELLPGIDCLDFATSRSEHYPLSGGVPVISPGDLSADLARRDFSVNAMAVSLNSSSFGDLIDRFDGQGDLHKRLLRVLHPASFIDDPARVIRGARFLGRFGFGFEEVTRGLALEAVSGGYLQRLPVGRLVDELGKAFEEPKLQPVIEALFALNIPQSLSPLFSLTDTARGALADCGNIIEGRREAVFAALTLEANDDEVARLISELALPQAFGVRLLQFRKQLSSSAKE